MKKKLCRALCFLCWDLMNVILPRQTALDDRWQWLGDKTIHFYWFIEDIGNRLFLLWFPGSDEEVRDALDLAYGECLDNYSDRQREIILRRDEWTELSLTE